MTALELPTQSKTVEAIFANYKKVGDSEPKRGYLGASIIGHSCARYLWYNFRQCTTPKIDGRTYRLFKTGDLEEARFVGDLQAIGCTVHEVGADGKQFAVSALGGQFSGHMDGCALGIPEAPKTWHVLEFKTHNKKSFDKLKKEGVQKSKPQHYAQMQVYMGLTGMTRALYLARNKDDDDLYSERVRFDKSYFDSLMYKAEKIIHSNDPPERIATREDWYECGWCDAHAICWGSPGPAFPVQSISCRQCCHATPTMDGNACWKCEKHKRGLSEFDQARSCNYHLVLPGLISFASPVDFGTSDKGDWVDYSCSDLPGAVPEFRNGAGGYSSKELTVVPIDKLEHELISAAKDLFGATVTSVNDDDIPF